MRKQTNKPNGLLKLIVLLAAAGVYSAAQAQVVINLNVNSDGSKLEITTPGACGAQPGKNGCLKANGRTPINFNLVQNKTCDAGGNWALNRVAIRMNEGGADGNLTADAALDFNANQATGIVSPTSQRDNHIAIMDYNHKAYTVWYKVYAACGGDEINSDPRVVNNGSGSLP